MVYVYVKQSQLNKYVGENLSVEEIEETLIDMGMDLKGKSDEKDPELKVEITAEKLDMVSSVGIAEAIKYYRGLCPNTFPSYSLEKTKEKVIVHSSTSGTYPPKTACAIVRGLSLTEESLKEIIDLQEKITISFARNRKKAGIGVYPINNIVFPITYFAEDPEKISFIPLGHKNKLMARDILTEHDTGKKYGHLISDKKKFAFFRDSEGKILAMPPIINSHETSKVTVDHSDIFIEVSGSNLKFLDNTLKNFVRALIHMGGKAEAVEVFYEETGETYVLSLDSYEEEISLEFVNKLIGVDFNTEQIRPLLNKMMYNLKEIKGDTLVVEVPCFRTDVWHDVDIADDIARAYGYNNISPSSPNVVSTGGTLPVSRFREQLSESMVAMGFLELYSYMLTSTDDQFKRLGFEEPDKEFIRLVDSAEEGINMTRVRVLPEVLKALHINRKNKYPQKVFENGFTIQIDGSQDTGAKNTLHLCAALADPKSNYTQIKGALDMFAKLNELDFEIKPAFILFMIEGRAAEIFYNKKSVGFIGELHPKVLEEFGLIVPVSCFEIVVQDLYKD